MSAESELSGHQEGGEEDEGEDQETYEEGQEEEELCEETPEEEEVRVEWPAGVPQASDKDLAKLSHKEGVGRHFLSVHPSFLPSFLPLPLTVPSAPLCSHRIGLFCLKAPHPDPRPSDTEESLRSLGEIIPKL